MQEAAVVQMLEKLTREGLVLLPADQRRFLWYSTIVAFAGLPPRSAACPVPVHLNGAVVLTPSSMTRVSKAWAKSPWLSSPTLKVTLPVMLSHVPSGPAVPAP